MKLDENEKIVAIEHLTPEPVVENGNGGAGNGGANISPSSSELGGKVEGDRAVAKIEVDEKKTTEN